MGHPGSRIVVTLKNGKKIESEIPSQLGHPLNPLSLEQVTDVSKSFLEVYLDPQQCELVLETMATLEESPDIRTMMDMLTYFHVTH